MGKGLLSTSSFCKDTALNCHVKYYEHELVKIFIDTTYDPKIIIKRAFGEP